VVMMAGAAGNGKRLGEAGRRYSGDRSNVHTECGRHSDEWLFGPMKSAARKMFEQRSPGGSTIGEHERRERGL
jgi:hypothetical protein